MEELKLALSQTTRAHEDQSNEIEELRKLSLSNRMSDTLPFLEEYLDIQGLSGDHPTTAETLLLDLRSQVKLWNL